MTLRGGGDRDFAVRFGRWLAVLVGLASQQGLSSLRQGVRGFALGGLVEEAE